MPDPSLILVTISETKRKEVIIMDPLLAMTIVLIILTMVDIALTIPITVESVRALSDRHQQ